MADRVETIETIVTATEVEALHLEQNLVKRHRPPFNVRLRDDKSFPYIAVTVEDDYPRVMFTRERHRRGVVYFGPYANAKKVRETLDVLNRVFRYRPCEGPQPGRHSGIPCLDFHIERCHAPCVGYISKEDYRELIDQVIEFLSGDDRPIRRRLEQQMREAAAEERFEDAARYRNRLRAIERLSERQAVERPSIGSIDVIGVAVSPERAAVQVFPLREGRMVDRHSFHLENAAGEELGEVLEQFCLEYYGVGALDPAADPRPARRRRHDRARGVPLERRGARVEVRAPERGEKRRLQELAQQNAQLALESETFVAETKRARRLEALEELREALNLESLPIRIECFDISNIQGQEIVGSMVVFQDAVAKKSHYRKFTVRGARRPGRLRGDARGDHAALLAPRADAGSEEWNESFAATPNLVVIDGGKGQLSAALAAMQELDLPRVAVDLAREADRGGLRPGPSDPILLPRSRLDCSSCSASATRRIASRSRFHRQRRDVARARVDVRPARRGRAGAPARAAAALRLGRARRRGDAGGARGRPGRAGEDGAPHLRAAAQDGTRITAAVGPSAAWRLIRSRNFAPVLRRQRGVGERHVVPEPRRVDPRLPPDALAVPARRPQLLPVRARARPVAVGRRARGPTRPAPAAARHAADVDCADRGAGRARVGRSRDRVGRDRLLAVRSASSARCRSPRSSR